MDLVTGTTSVARPVQNSRALRIASLVEPAWLEEHLADEDLRIVDVTIQVKLKPLPWMRSGKREWKRAHIPGAAFADLRRLCDPHSPVRLNRLSVFNAIPFGAGDRLKRSHVRCSLPERGVGARTM